MYKTLDIEDNFDLDIEFCSKYTNNINLFLRVIDFWGVKFPPKEFFILLYDTRPIKNLEELIAINNCKYYKFLLFTFGICAPTPYLRNPLETKFIHNPKKISIFYGCKNEIATAWLKEETLLLYSSCRRT